MAAFSFECSSKYTKVTRQKCICNGKWKASGVLLSMGDYKTKLISERDTAPNVLDSRGKGLLEMMNKFDMQSTCTLNMCQISK